MVVAAAQAQSGAAAAQKVEAPGTSPAPKLYQRVEPALRIGPGDLVEVTVFDTPELSGKLRVDASGAVELPMAGVSSVAGLTPSQAAETIAKHLKDSGIMIEPRVTVGIAEFATQQVSVLGEVRSPGNYLLLGPHSLYSAISAAGGTNENAGDEIVLTHADDPEHPEIIKVRSPEDSNVERLTTVRAGDVVFVSRAGFIYVLGDVAKPGQFAITAGKRLTVLEAIALAQGTNSDAALTRAAIIRKSGESSNVIPLDLKRMTQKGEGDQLLYAEDIVVVPKSRGRAFLDATLPGLTGSVAGSAITAMVLLGTK